MDDGEEAVVGRGSVDTDGGMGGGRRGGWRKREDMAVVMQRRERKPKTALHEGTICKVKNWMHHLLEPLQSWILLHFADAKSDPTSAGDGLMYGREKGDLVFFKSHFSFIFQTRR
jgi:hypothetical protein